MFKERAVQGSILSVWLSRSRFWEQNGLQTLTDGVGLITVARQSNGGTNGLEERRWVFPWAKAMCGV